MWTNWLERILRPREREDEAWKCETVRTNAPVVHAPALEKTLDRPRMDASRNTLEHAD